MPEVLELGIGALRRAIEAGETDPVSVARACLERIDELAHLNAWVEVRPEALDEAPAARGALAGVPVAVKDVFVDGGRAPTCGSRVRATWLSGTASVVRRLREAGAIVVGYANLHEWAIGMSSAVTATGPVVNPWDETLVPGGSSGGSAVALAAGMVPAAVGSDAGGSIRCPSACCGVTGLKPTWDRVPTKGFAGDGGTIDHVGPMARSVADVTLLFGVMAGEEIALDEVSGLRVGIPRSFFFDDLDPELGAAVEGAIEVVRGLVAEVREVELPSAPLASFAVPGLLLPLFARRLDGILARDPDMFQPPTARLLELGSDMSEEDLIQAGHVKAEVEADWERVFAEVDVVVTPTLPGRPAALDTLMLELPSGPASPELAYLRTNAPMNLGGVPALLLPCGELPGGLTTNLTLTAARSRDELVLSLGEAFERATESVYTGRIASRTGPRSGD